MNLLKNLKEKIAKELSVPVEKIEESEKFGDLAYPCFELAKESGKNPVEIAKQLEEKLSRKSIEFIKEVKATGPYLNFYIDWKKFGKILLESIDENYGKITGNKKVVIDLSSPNPAHPFHLGTLRSTIIGESLARILEYTGWKPTRFCYINNLGKQAATLLYAYKTLADGKEPEGKPDVWLGKLYFEMAKKLNDEKISEKIKEIIKNLEKGDKETKELAEKVFGWCLNGFQKNWNLLGIKFDVLKFETDFVEEGKKIVNLLKEKGIAKESEGAIIVDLEKYGLPNTVLLRSDGTGLYLTRDLACTIWKLDTFKPDLNLYVVAEDQSLHFKQQFKLLELLGYDNSICKHIGYGMVLLEGKKMSARKGWYVTFDEVLEEGTKRAKEEIKSRWKDLDEKEIEDRAEKIALAAINFFILKYSNEKTVNFIWKEALSFEGNSGPYIQYTYARANSVLRKGGKTEKFDIKEINEYEREILRIISKYPDIIEKASKEFRPNILADYLIGLADKFNSFYQNVPILKSEEKDFRIKITEAVKNILQSGAKLLLIEFPEVM